MARNTSIVLSDELAGFVDGQVNQGRYTSASEVVRAGLRLLEAQQVQLDALRQALIAGEESGAPEQFDFDAFLAKKDTA